MAPPQMSEDEVDDLIYLARTGEKDELQTLVSALAEREKVSAAEILVAAKDGGESTCLHMATGNGHLGMGSHVVHGEMEALGGGGVYSAISHSVLSLVGGMRCR